MLNELKPLVVVLALALVVFAIAKPVCLNFMALSDFTRRRNVWFVLTCTGFVAPNIWLFAAVALPLVFWATYVDRHPTALYLMLLLTVPPASLPIPLPLVNQLFELSPFRILALALLVPAAARIVRSGGARPPGLVQVDLMLIAYGILQLALYMPYESVTNTMRRAFLFGLDTYALYFVFSRGAATKPALHDTLASFWLACAILVPITVFESAKGWLLYTGIPSKWGAPNDFSWLLRDGMLRAQASGGHSLVMGYLFAIALGFWLYLGGRIQSRRLLWGVGAAMWCGLFATFARAPWIVAAVILVLYLWISPAGRRRIVGTTVGLAVGVVALSATPFGARVVDSLPFIGTVEQGNVDYRQQLATVSWRLIQQNPFFGNPFAGSQMQELRQGQGIIDLVNTYAAIGVFYGLVGLALFVGCLVYPVFRAILVAFASRNRDVSGANLGAMLVACMLGTLVMAATVSFGLAFELIAWVLAGLCCAYTTAMYSQSSNAFGRQGAAPFRAEPVPQTHR